MKNINIPEPCSEKWNEMSSTQKGAFCQKCAIDVYDFTNKSGDEIRDILRLNIGSRVCGKIQPKQLDQLNDDFSAWQITNKQSYHRAWGFTLLVVFGMTLFSCEEDEVPVVQELQKTAQTFLMGMEDLTNISVSDTITIKEVDTSENDIKTQVVRNVEEIVIMPDPELIVEMLGEVAYVEEQPIEALVIPERSLEKITHTHMLGAMVATPRYTESLVELTESKTCENIMSGLVYPNPAINQTTLKVNMPSRGKVGIELYELSGKKIRTIHSGRIQKGESEFQIDLTGLETGMYLVMIYAGGKKETIKFSKI